MFIDFYTYVLFFLSYYILISFHIKDESVCAL